MDCLSLLRLKYGDSIALGVQQAGEDPEAGLQEGKIETQSTSKSMGGIPRGLEVGMSNSC